MTEHDAEAMAYEHAIDIVLTVVAEPGAESMWLACARTRDVSGDLRTSEVRVPVDELSWQDVIVRAVEALHAQMHPLDTSEWNVRGHGR